MARAELPRVVIGGLAGDAGKSLVAVGLTRALRERGLRVGAFKKGPDFIDAAWMGAAAGSPGRNLDTFLMSEEAVLRSVARSAAEVDVAVVEGNRGLFDGVDADGTHSTARLAQLLGAPVVLVVNATKMTRTVAALVVGCKALEPDLWLAGVVLNRVATGRQERVVREALARHTDVAVLGSIPKLPSVHLPSRHLGLTTAVEHPDAEAAIEQIAEAVEQYVDVGAVLDVARQATGALATETTASTESRGSRKPGSVRVGVLQDRAFSFYYPENLEALESRGAQLVPVSPLADDALPEVDALYAGGGFPEEYTAQLSSNQGMRESVERSVREGLPVWAECGGLMYLSRAIEAGDATHPMVGALPVVVQQMARPQGHGYVAATVDTENRFLEQGSQLRGHEFHYSRIRRDGPLPPTVLALERGSGVGEGRDGIQVGSVLASYTHVHALGTDSWAEGLVRAARGGTP